MFNHSSSREVTQRFPREETPTRDNVSSPDPPQVDPSVFARAVVVGVDGQRHTRIALDWATRWAVNHGLRLVLVGCYDDSAESAGHRRASMEELLDDERTDIACYYPDLRVETVALPDAPAAALAFASQFADLTVTGTRGDGDVTTYFTCGVPEELSRIARGPVAVVPHNVDIAPGGSVVVGLDESGATQDALLFAVDAATASRLPLVAVHACDHHTSPTDHVSDDVVATAATAHTAACPKHVRPSLASRWLKRLGLAYPQLTVVQALEPAMFPQPWDRSTVRASMVVVAARARGRFARLVDGTTDQVLARTARCPAVIVPQRQTLAGA